MRRISEDSRRGETARSGGDGRRLLESSRRERLSSLACFFIEPASSSHSRGRFDGGAVGGLSSRSRAAASAACMAAAGGGAPLVMLGVPALGWCW